MTLKSRFLAQWKTITAVLVLFVIGSVFLYGGIANAWDDYKLMSKGQIVQGFITETWEDVEDSESGGSIWYHGAIYMYQLPDGRELEGNLNGEGKLKPEFRNLTQPYPIKVTYLVDNPAVSRITNDLPDSTPSLLRDQIYPYGLFSAIFLFIGFYILWKIVRGLKHAPEDP